MQNEHMNQSIDKWQVTFILFENIIDIKCTNTLCCYQWRLPRYKSLEIESLCSDF